MRKVQSLLCPYLGTTGKAAMLASGLPFLLTSRKFVESGDRNIEAAFGARDSAEPECGLNTLVSCWLTLYNHPRLKLLSDLSFTFTPPFAPCLVMTARLDPMPSL